MREMTNHRCFKCARDAVWEYAPGKGETDDYYCDEHVARGCSCNHVLQYYGDDDTPSLEETVKEARDNGENVDDEGHCLDDENRRLPCVEYWFSEDGFEDAATLADRMIAEAEAICAKRYGGKSDE